MNRSADNSTVIVGGLSLALSSWQIHHHHDLSAKHDYDNNDDDDGHDADDDDRDDDDLTGNVNHGPFSVRLAVVT